MKHLLTLTLTALALLSGCSSPLGRLERIWPDGASVKIIKPQITVSMTGAGSFTADEISWIGTNGFRLYGSTNTVTTTTSTSK